MSNVASTLLPFLATMLPVSATISYEISSFRQSRNKLNMLNLFRLCRKDEIFTIESFDIVAVFGTKSNVASTKLPVASTLFASVDGALRTTPTDYDRHHRPLLVWPSYSMCRRASNKLTEYTTHTQCDSPGGSMRGGQRTFRPDNQENRQICSCSRWQDFSRQSLSKAVYIVIVTNCLWFARDLCRCKERGSERRRGEGKGKDDPLVPPPGLNPGYAYARGAV